MIKTHLLANQIACTVLSKLFYDDTQNHKNVTLSQLVGKAML